MSNLYTIPTTKVSREVGMKSWETTSAAAKGTAGMTPSLNGVSELSPRRKRKLFRQTLLYAAKKALKAGLIDGGAASDYESLVDFYRHPWKKNSAGVLVDRLDSLRNYLNGLIYAKYNDANLAGAYVTDWWGQNIRAVGQTKLLARDWLASSDGMLGSDGSATTGGTLYKIAALLVA
jgi:hypothetical protein